MSGNERKRLGSTSLLFTAAACGYQLIFSLLYVSLLLPTKTALFTNKQTCFLLLPVTSSQKRNNIITKNTCGGTRQFLPATNRPNSSLLQVFFHLISLARLHRMPKLVINRFTTGVARCLLRNPLHQGYKYCRLKAPPPYIPKKRGSSQVR